MRGISSQKAHDIKHPADLTRTHLATLLGELAHLERMAAHLLAGWVPGIVSLRGKVATARAAHRHMQRADGLRRQVWALTRLDDHAPRVRVGARSFMQAIEAVPNETTLFASFDSFLRPLLRECYRYLGECCDPLIHEGTLLLCRSAMLELETGLNEDNQPGLDPQLRARLDELWRNRAQGEELEPDEVLWPPRDRVPQAQRPSDLPRDEPGALRTIPINANRSPRDIGIQLHRNLDGEYTTMELTARNSYEHPDLPWRFHLDLLRQSADEARHAVMVDRLMVDYNVRYGDFPVNTIGYDSLYEFPELESGSREELLWRLLIRQTYQEGMALDSLAYEIRRRRYLGQERHAEVLEHLLADEVFHAESGIRWSKYLLGGDEEAVRAEREKAVKAWGTNLDRRRANFVEHFPERALQEIALLEEADNHSDLPFEMILNSHARLEAGFMEEDMDQVVDWGFSKRAQSRS